MLLWRHSCAPHGNFLPTELRFCNCLAGLPCVRKKQTPAASVLKMFSQAWKVLCWCMEVLDLSKGGSSCLHRSALTRCKAVIPVQFPSQTTSHVWNSLTESYHWQAAQEAAPNVSLPCCGLLVEYLTSFGQLCTTLIEAGPYTISKNAPMKLC